jgi:SAM-dependent methyltransferase
MMEESGDNRPFAVTEYLLSQQGARDLERSRLKLLEEINDPLSVAQLDAIGVSDGWRCLDVGAGGGSVTRMLAERVGRTGSVLAVDLDTSLLEPLASERIEVRRHDLLSDSLPEDTFDLVHARLLLMHLPARLVSLARLAAAARPGGWVAVIDPDFTTVALSPSNPTWERIWSVFCDTLVAGGWDPRYGARLHGDLQSVGLTNVHADYVASCGPGGRPVTRLTSLSLERLRGRMVDLGAHNEEIDEARRLLDDPANTVRSITTCVARAQRP